MPRSGSGDMRQSPTARIGAIILIAGPTASGKSALALGAGREARRRHRQCRLDAGLCATCASSRRGRRRTRRRACRTASTAMSTRRTTIRSGRWCVDAGSALADAARRGRVAILVGGTGLYFKALTQGLAAVPPIPPDIRADGAAAPARTGAAGAARRACARDPVDGARLMPRRPLARRPRARGRRGDRPLARRLAPDGVAGLIDGHAPSRCFSRPSATRLSPADRARFAAMLAAGALDEVRALAARRLDPRAAGHEGARRALADPASRRARSALDERGRACQVDTRRYAKRQVTWFRKSACRGLALESQARQGAAEALEAVLRAESGATIAPAA